MLDIISIEPRNPDPLGLVEFGPTEKFLRGLEEYACVRVSVEDPIIDPQPAYRYVPWATLYWPVTMQGENGITYQGTYIVSREASGGWHITQVQFHFQNPVIGRNARLNFVCARGPLGYADHVGRQDGWGSVTDFFPGYDEHVIEKMSGVI